MCCFWTNPSTTLLKDVKLCEKSISLPHSERATFSCLALTVSILIMPSKHPSLHVVFPVIHQKLFESNETGLFRLPSQQTNSRLLGRLVLTYPATLSQLSRDSIFLPRCLAPLLSEASHHRFNNIIVTP